ncbi:MAG TPA: T9SS type A sorting domain-containing protein [Bacteroidales bacterium]|nr:T9SS type A sorting domain-containing protein [Bacteroidales bacterium]HSA44474.1 T9SS type A sorting domain-containing protein [Bacteroidales bacterium]
MKKIYILFIIALSLRAAAQSNLAMLYSSAGMEYGKASAIDADTNYINGSLFQNTINVNPNGTTNLTAPGATTHIALTKYNREGQLLWAKMFGGVTTSEAPHGIDCDAAKNIYVTGYFGSTTLTGPQNADFNPLGGGTVTTQGNEDCFVAKYDQNGNYQWAFGLGNISQETQERAWDISTDANGNSYVVGGFHGTINFNPLGTAMNYALPDTLVGLFISKYNTNGICQWVIMLDAQCTSVFTEGYATCNIDNLGNLYVAGNFRGSNINFNPLGTLTTLTSSGLTDMFIAKYDVINGNLYWVKKIGGTAQDIVSPGALRCDNNGNPYFTGRLSGTGSVDFDPSAGTSNITNSALFLVSYDASGNLRYVTGMNSGAGDGGHRVSFDNLNNVYIAGWMNGTATFGTFTRTANSLTADVFLAKYNNNLTNCSWALNFGGTGSTANNICAGLSVDQENNPIITGQLYGTNANVNPLGTTALNLSSVGNNDCFVIKYNSDGNLWQNTTVGLNNLHIENNKIKINPNPTTNFINFETRLAINSALIYNTLGQHFNCKIESVKIDVSNLETGIYFILFTDQLGKTYTTKFVKN